MSGEKIIRNQWQHYGQNIEVSRILDRNSSAEGLDYNQYRSVSDGCVSFSTTDGHIVSLLTGEANLKTNKQDKPLVIEAPSHIYIPAGYDAKLELVGKCFVVHASASADRARGSKLIVRNEKYVRSVRYILTPQYVSRRVFVHRDKTLLSKYNQPVSWFRTTMFDTKGLPKNFEGKSVFKMGYNFQTEPNQCYQVVGDVCVRFAKHPYVSAEQQVWSAWEKLDGDTLYYLNETSEGDDIEWYNDKVTGEKMPLRNRHEVFVPEGGFASLICLFNPAPTGLEQHMPGEYSAYSPVAETLKTDKYKEYLKEIAPEDEMMDVLSMFEAEGKTDEARQSPQWLLYEKCLSRKIQQDGALYEKLKSIGEGRETIIDQWMIKQ